MYLSAIIVIMSRKPPQSNPSVIFSLAPAGSGARLQTRCFGAEGGWEWGAGTGLPLGLGSAPCVS